MESIRSINYPTSELQQRNVKAKGTEEKSIQHWEKLC